MASPVRRRILLSSSTRSTAAGHERCDRRSGRRAGGGAAAEAARPLERGRCGQHRAPAARRSISAEHVVAGDATTDAGAGDGRRVDAVLLDQATDERRQQRPAARRRGRSRRAEQEPERAQVPAARCRCGRGLPARAGAGCGPAPERAPLREPERLPGGSGAGSAGGCRGGGRRRRRHRRRRARCRRRRCRPRAPGSRSAHRRPAPGTSVSTLSVDTSNSGSSSATVSPTCLNQRVIVPSVTDSPSWGITMSAMCAIPSMRSDSDSAAGPAEPVRPTDYLSPTCLVTRPGRRRARPHSAVQRATGHGQHRLAEELGQRRVRLDELGDLVDRRLPVDRQVPARQLLGDPRARPCGRRAPDRRCRRPSSRR